MKPPVCEACGHAPAADLVRFADYTPLPEGMVGHPPGLGWFCTAHLHGARALRDRPMPDALRVLRRCALPWWRRFFA